MTNLEYNYANGLKLIAQWLKIVANLPFTIATNLDGHPSLRFRFKGIEHEVNGIIGPKVAVLKRSMPEIVNRMELGQACLNSPVEIDYQDGPLQFCVYQMRPSYHKLFADENPLAVVEFIMHDLK